jgi:hypothetical protein
VSSEPVGNLSGAYDRQRDYVWATQDNGSTVMWDQASAYCASLGSGWRLPSVAQLKSLFGNGVGSKAREGAQTTIQLDTVIVLAGESYWTADRNGDDAAWYVSLQTGAARTAVIDYQYALFRALCVRRS